MNISIDEYNKLKNKKKNKKKYGNTPVWIDDIYFPSTREGKRYIELKLLRKAGLISDLFIHPKFTVCDEFIYRGDKYKKIQYESDFMYYDHALNETVVEDVKSDDKKTTKTKLYELKRNIFLTRYGYKYKFIES